MKKTVVLLTGVLSVMAMAGCRKNTEEITSKGVRLEKSASEMVPSLYEDLPANYGYEDAVADSLFIISDMKEISGEEKWDDFLQNVSEGESCSILIGEYYELVDESHYSKEYYESIKDEYPQFYLKELFYDGTSYSLVSYENDQKYEYDYPYMIERSGKMGANAAVSMNGYFLVRDIDVSFEELMWAVLSSNSADWIDYRTVFMITE